MNSEKPMTPGALHPLTLITEEIVRIFSEMGFVVALGPELEDEWHNFDALNVSKDHPARDMQDTFWIKGSDDAVDAKGHSTRKVMRTHTSPVQIRYMETHTPPFAIIAPGKVFRNEATDTGHEMQFYQIEGLVVGEGITLAHLKGTLLTFFQKIFGEDIELRLNPSYFPFTEPSMEVSLVSWKSLRILSLYMYLRYGVRTIPSLCSAVIEPLYSCTSV